MNKENLVKLAKIAANANSASPVAYSFGEEKYSKSEVNEVLRTELKSLAGTYALYRENKNTIFSLMEEVIDDVLPKKVMEQFNSFAEIKQVAQSDKAVFVQRITEASRRRAKQFVTKVGLAGRYEVFKLDGRELTVTMTAIGGAAQIGFEEFLDGRVDFADLVTIITEGMNDYIMKEIYKALIACASTLQANNKAAASGFVNATFDHLVTVARAYGDATVYCTYDFAAKMLPANINEYSDRMKDEVWANGRLLSYKNCNVVILDESFRDETNGKLVFDPSYAFIIPSGAKKPVKIAFEGQTAVRESENEDWSRELETYKKFGVATMVTNDICIYRDTALALDYKKSITENSSATLANNWEYVD